MEKPKEERETHPKITRKPKELEFKETQVPKTTMQPKELQKETQAPKLATKPKELEKQTQQSKTTSYKPKEVEKETKKITSTRVVWDCESSLYDSFELKSFERQLDSAILSSRTLSMPHLSDHRKPPPPTASHHHDRQKPMSLSKKPSKLSRSIHKFLRSVFRVPKQNSYNNGSSSSSSWFRIEKGSREGVYCTVYDTSGVLTPIPEGTETFAGELSPELKSYVRRSASDRFAPASLGISCA